MSKKILEQEFLKRFYRNFPDANIKLLDYSAISNPLHIQCMKCGKKDYKPRAREFLNSFNCCIDNSKSKVEKLQTIYSNSLEFDFIKQVDKDHYIVHHNTCGNDIMRVIGNALDNPFACKYCNTSKFSNMLSLAEAQQQLDDRFGNIQILDYNGQLEKNHYKCLKCGLIFVQKHICLLQSRGCPKCDRYKSQGEKQIKKLLDEQHINYKEQVAVTELPLQHFDFGVYDNQDRLLYFIEVQGEQHREERGIFRDGLAKIQERDQRKRNYCAAHNISLYELIYQKGKIINFDILPFNSTTISAKESTL